jgi:CelD/BcsL family acetyltransferase involved in cellulose biosynthesis
VTDLRFDWITTRKELNDLEPHWRALDDGHAPGAVFRSFEWQATWWRILGDDPKRRRALRVLVGRDAAGVVRGILPMYVEDASVVRFIEQRRAALLADGVVGSDYLGLVARAEDEVPLAPLFARRVAEDPMLADADLIDVCDLASDDPLGDATTRAFRGAPFSDVSAVPQQRCPYVLLTMPREQYFASRPKKAAERIRRQRGMLAKMKGFRLDTFTTPDDVGAAMEPLFALHRARWTAEGGSQAIPDERVTRFHREAGRLLAERGWARLTLLSVGDEPAAAAYGFMRAGRFAYYQAGLSPDWRKHAAGTVVLAELIGRAFDENLGEIDFLRGQESYKYVWTDRERVTVSVRAMRATARARVAAGVERAIHLAGRAAKRFLSPPTIARLRGMIHP